MLNRTIKIEIVKGYILYIDHLFGATSYFSHSSNITCFALTHTTCVIIYEEKLKIYFD